MINSKTINIIFLIAAVLLIFIGIGCVSAANITVNNSSSSSIQTAINNAHNNDTLNLQAGTYKQYNIKVNKNITISGASKTNTTINAMGSNLIFWIKPGTIVTIKNLNITNGTASNTDFNRNGGGIFNEGTLIIDNCIFYNNRASDASDADGDSDADAAGNGGAIYNKGTLTITNCEFTGNHAGQGGDASATHHSSTGGSGGAIYNEGIISNIQACTFRNNYAGRGGASSAWHDGHKGGDGGAIYNTGTINNILSCIFTTNHAGNGGSTKAGTAANPGAGGNGGAIYSNNTVTVTNSTFDGNYAGNGGDGSDIQDGANGGYGGAIYNGGAFTISGSEIKNSHTGTGGFGPAAAKDGADGYGGAIINMKTLTINNCNIHNNNANDGYGGGIINSGSLSLQDSQIHDNLAGNGGGISNQNQISIINCQNYNNKASNNGGGIWNSATLTLQNLTIKNNIAVNYGGGIYNTGILTLKNFTITNNTANYGGGIGNANKLKLYDSNITYNTATTHGGGIYNTNLIYLVNTQFTSNTPDKIYGSTNCVVNSRTTELYNTIQDAINKASANDTLLIQTGTYKENLSITKNISLNGTSYTNTILNGNQMDCCIKVSQGFNVYISGLTITNGNNNYDVNADGSYLGGGIDNEGGNLSIYQVIISNNFATDKGGGIYNTGTLTINNCTFNNNTVENHHNDIGTNKIGKANGGAIYNTGTLTITNTIFTKNIAYDANADSGNGMGAAIYSNSASNIAITNCTFQSNTADAGGGAIYTIGTGIFNVSNSTFQSNKAYYPILPNADLYKSECYGGAIYSGSNLIVTNSNFKSNTAFYGGAIYSISRLSVSNSIFQSNKAWYAIEQLPLSKNLIGGYGGAIFTTNNLNMTNCTFTSNSAVYGGSLYGKSSGNLTVANSTFTYNTVKALDKNGDPITYLTYDAGSPWEIIQTLFMIASGITQMKFDFKTYWANSIATFVSETEDIVSNFQKNTIEAVGGAIYLADNCNLNVKNSNFNNNTASMGGAIDNFGNGTVNVINSTFNYNNAGFGGAIYSNNLGPLNVTGSIFNDNYGGSGGAIFYGGTTDHAWADLTVKENIFTGNWGYLGGVVYLGIQGVSHSTINFNRIYGTDNYDLYNEYPSSDLMIDGKYNWWGTNDGPGTYNTNTKNNIDTSPYMVLTVKIDPSTIYYGDTSTITADMLHDNNGTYRDPAHFGLIPDGIPIIFNTATGTITPQSAILINGITIANYTANGDPSVSSVDINASADQSYPVVTKTINIQKIPTNTYLNPVSNFAGQNVTLVAKVTDNSGSLINVGKVIFNIGIAQIDPVSVVNGYAEYYLHIPEGTQALLYTINAIYNGTNIYNSSQATANLIVSQASIGSTGITVNPPVNGTQGQTVNLVARLIDAYNNQALSGKTLTFSVNGNNVGSATTDSNGVANLSYRLLLPAGSYTVLASFAGESSYSGSSNTGMINVMPSPTGVSDLTITRKVQSIVRLGDKFTVTIKIGNKGPDVAKDVVIKFSIPPGLEFITASVDQGTWTYNQATRVFTWNLGDVAVGDPYLYITLKATKIGKYLLKQLLSTTTFDPNLANQMSPLSIVISAPEEDNENNGQESSVNGEGKTVNAAGQTIGMQKTGLPIAGIILAILMLIGGLVSSKRK